MFSAPDAMNVLKAGVATFSEKRSVGLLNDRSGCDAARPATRFVVDAACDDRLAGIGSGGELLDGSDAFGVHLGRHRRPRESRRIKDLSGRCWC